jgi:hypothetical protein
MNNNGSVNLMWLGHHWYTPNWSEVKDVRLANVQLSHHSIKFLRQLTCRLELANSYWYPGAIQQFASGPSLAGVKASGFFVFEDEDDDWSNEIWIVAETRAEALEIAAKYMGAGYAPS